MLDKLKKSNMNENSRKEKITETIIGHEVVVIDRGITRLTSSDRVVEAMAKIRIKQGPKKINMIPTLGEIGDLASQMIRE